MNITTTRNATAGGVLLVVALAVAGFLASAFVVMVVWGAVGMTFFETGAWHTIGYGTACLVTAAIGVLKSLLR